MYINKNHYTSNIKNHYLEKKVIENKKNTCNNFSEHMENSFQNQINTLHSKINEIKNSHINLSTENYLIQIFNKIQKSHISLNNLEKIRDAFISTYHEIMNINV